jgi:hypothetical protein
MMINDNDRCHNGIANGTTTGFVNFSQTQNLFQFKCLATGYTLLRLTEVDQLGLVARL